MLIVGYFSTSQQIIYGKNKSGNNIYLVDAFNSENNKYLVSFGGKLKGKIIIVFEKINELYNFNSKIPCGKLIDIIGLMNDSNLLLTLQYIYNINRKNINNIYKNTLLITNLIDKNIFSIDPNNCNDIDDCLSIDEDKNNYIIGVYIAQPIFWLSEEILMNRVKNSFSTLYNDNYDKNNNLWGNEITELSSLSINQKKPAYCIFYYIDKIKLNITKIEDYPCTIINKIQTNYDECLNYKDIRNLYILTKLLNSEKSNFCTHELVSYWMIKTNNYIGNKFKNLNLPYRVMKFNQNIIKDSELENNLDCITNNEIKNIFLNKIKDNAYYSLDEYYHYKLDTYNYTHFTSPIRRIIDTLINWCINYNINFKELLNKYDYNIDHINQMDKFTRKYHNNIKLLNNINNLKYDENFIKGWIYKISKEKSKINVYFLELGFISIKIQEEIDVSHLLIGNEYNFKFYKKIGFLPYQKIFIKLIVDL